MIYNITKWFLIIYFTTLQIAFSQEIENFYVVNDDHVNIRTEPDITSNVVEYNVGKKAIKRQLFITEVVKVLKKDQREVTIGNHKGQWIYVEIRTSYDSKLRKQLSGWVFSYYLSKPEDFTLLNNLKNNMHLEWPSDIEGCLIMINKDGSFYHPSTKGTGKLFIDKSKRVIVPIFNTEMNKEKDVKKVINKALFKFREVLFMKPDGMVCIKYGLPPDYTTCAKIIQN